MLVVVVCCLFDGSSSSSLMFKNCKVMDGCLCFALWMERFGEKEVHWWDICSRLWESWLAAGCPECLHLVTCEGQSAV